jgi:hypothetical protein
MLEKMSGMKQQFLTKWQPGRRPILISGDARSGTSWVGILMAAAWNTLYYHEPANPYTSGIWDLDPWYRYFRPGQHYNFYERTLDPAFKGLDAPGLRWNDRTWVRLVPGYQIVIKDVTTFMNLEWIYDRYNPLVVVLLRHPCAVVLSQLREARVPQPQMEIMLAQDELFEDHLHKYKSVMESAVSTTEMLTALWAAKHKVVANVLENHPDWRLQSYDDLCEAPTEQFKAIYNFFGLKWTKAVERTVIEHSSLHEDGMYSIRRISKLQAGKWKKEIEPEQLVVIRRIVDSFELPFFSKESDWSIN